MTRRTSLVVLVTATAAAVFVPVASVQAQTPSGSTVLTTLTAFDAPPEQGGKVINSAPLIPPPPDVDPAAILSDLQGPVAALLDGEASSFEAETGQSTAAPRAASAEAQDVTLLDCYASSMSERPEGWVV